MVIRNRLFMRINCLVSQIVIQTVNCAFQFSDIFLRFFPIQCRFPVGHIFKLPYAAGNQIYGNISFAVVFFNLGFGHGNVVSLMRGGRIDDVERVQDGAYPQDHNEHDIHHIAANAREPPLHKRIYEPGDDGSRRSKRKDVLQAYLAHDVAEVIRVVP